MDKLVIATLVIMLILYLKHQAGNVKLVKIDINSTKLYGEVKILHITDFHSNKLIDQKKLIESIRTMKPDLIAMTGDMVEREIKPVKELMVGVGNLGIPTYVVLGNHEEMETVASDYIEVLNENDITYLDNKAVTQLTDSGTINIVGLKHYEPDNYIPWQNLDTKLYNLLLIHAPNLAIRYANGMEDLILSGHTHGGQIRMPFIGALYVPDQSFKAKYDKGIYELKCGTILHVDSGIGNRLIPLRFLNRIQMTLITINRRQ